jgi:hypothetical protein
VNKFCVFSNYRRLRILSLWFFVLLCLLTTGACGSDPSVEVYDNSRVLNIAQVQNAASALPDPVAIYTTNTLQGTPFDFQQIALQKLQGNPGLLVLAIDTGRHYLSIAHGSSVSLSSAGLHQAVSAFSARFTNGDYTAASVAALHALQRSLSDSMSRAGSGGGLLTGPTLFCCIVPLLLVLCLVLFVASRRKRLGEMMSRRNPFGQRSSPFDQPGPLDQGPLPPQPAQGGGINPWMAGGLGAAAGGLAGYELGRRQGEQGQSRENAPGGDAGGDFGSSGNPWNTGGGGDFGSSGNPWNTGGGGDFGGGGGGSWGGSGDSGSDEFDQGGGGDF